MKKLAPPKKLQLALESLRSLDEVQLRNVVGGVSLPGNPCGTTHSEKSPGG